MFTLQNTLYKVGILLTGAELRSVINKQTGKEYIWQADASVWSRSSPVLFPFVGRLKNEMYTFQNKTYNLPQHGFARNFDFECIKQTDYSVCFELNSNEQTLENYPFHFSLQLTYELIENELSLTYRVENTDTKEMYFSLGAHPAFLLENDLEEYTLEFNLAEKFERHVLQSGLRTLQTLDVPMDGKRLALKKTYFEEDAIVLQGMKSNEISILHKQHQKELSLKAEGFPYYGIWTKKPYPFLCLEPWHGIADSIESTGELEKKEGIIKLASREVFFSRITFSFF
jgi:galactose mutarotase-like enzyme